ncbi:MAG: hypothetical protein HJJLKODD_01848 [Phycisphaerae bacterium]|nr:hypothetical protein [Phycisphaerae bacterium]
MTLMSNIPGNMMGPILQSGPLSQELARVRDNERAQQERATEASRKVHQLDSVEETDNDSKVHTESEGAGSKGRQLDSQTPEESPEESSDVQTDDQGQTHLDLQA